MIQLQACSVGTRAPTGDFAGSVHSVFRATCNIRSGSGWLALVLASQPNLPHGVRLAKCSAPPFEHTIPIGARAACRGGVLRIASVLAVDLRTGVPWTGNLRGVGVDFESAAFAPRWRRAWQHAAGVCRSEDRILDRVALAEAARIAVRDMDDRAAAARLYPLIGLGPGLTPVGDDVIVGYLAGLWVSFGPSEPGADFVARLGRRVRGAARATTAISQLYLDAAADGQVSEPVFNLLRAFGQESETSFDAALQSALRVGASSGAGGVLGLLTGLAAGQPVGTPALAVAG